MQYEYLVHEDHIKEVHFQGDTLLAIYQQNKTFVGVKWVTEAIGLTRSQGDRQIRNIRNDDILMKGTADLLVPTNGGPQSIVAIEIDFLPLWLAKISVTPTMKRESPDVAEKLMDYQLKAKDVLAQAFIRPKTSAELLLAQAELLVQAEQRMAQMEAVQRSQQQTLQQQEERLSTMIGFMAESPVRARVNRKVQELARHQNMGIQEAWHHIYRLVYDKYGIDLRRRIENKRHRINRERDAEGKRPYSASTLRQKVNALDVIMDEDMGKEIIEIIIGMIGRSQTA